MSFNKRNSNTVLVLMPDKHMGNVVVSLPAIVALKEFFKGKKFFLVIDEAYSDIVEPLIRMENVFFFPRKQLKKNHFIKRVTIFSWFIHQLRGISPDIAIDLQGGYASSILTYLSGAPVRVARSTAKRAYLYNREVKLSEGKHKVYNYTDIASAVGAHSIDIYYRLKAMGAKKASLSKKLLDECIISDMPIACIHPGAGRFFRQWNSGGYADLSDWLLEEGFQVFLVGSSNDDLKKIDEIISLTKNKIYNLGGKLSIGELMALLEISSLYIGNDSGPMHIAAAMGTPVIALFGPGVDRRWRPLSDKAIVLRGAERCQKCKGKDCQFDFRCIKTLSSEAVKTAIRELLEHGAYDIIEKKF
jgi:lipopolysaccharide heptosyltransferase II